MTIWFTSDTHFGHKNIIKHCKRPYENAILMDEDIIAKWNSVIKPADEVWHLGDFSFHRSDWRPDQHILERLHGTKHLIVGNHDSYGFMRKCDEWTTVTDGIKDITFKIGEANYCFVLSHYPIREWNGFYHGAYHLFGHVHAQMAPYCRSMDVGVDTHDFMPYSLEEIIALLEPATNKHPGR